MADDRTDVCGLTGRRIRRCAGSTIAAEDLPAPEHADAIRRLFRPVLATPSSCCWAKPPTAPASSIARGPRSPGFLIQNHGFNIVAVEADWPDAARIDRYVRHGGRRPRRAGGLCTFPQLDVAQPGDAGIRPLVARGKRASRGDRAGGISRAGHLQPLGFHQPGARLSGQGRSGRRADRPASLRLPDALAGRTGRLRTFRRDGRRYLRAGGQRAVDGSSACSGWTMPPRTASPFSTRRRTPASCAPPNNIIASCITARANPGICATATCSTRLQRLMQHRPRRQGDRLGA